MVVVMTNEERAMRKRAKEATGRQRQRARSRAANAIRTGQIKRGSRCEFCKGRGSIVAHHSDYTMPLTITWLCRRCHTQLHVWWRQLERRADESAGGLRRWAAVADVECCKHHMPEAAWRASRRQAEAYSQWLHNLNVLRRA